MAKARGQRAWQFEDQEDIQGLVMYAKVPT